MGNRYLFWFCVGFVATVMIWAISPTALVFMMLLALFTAFASSVLSGTGHKASAIIVIISVMCSIFWQSVYFEHDKLPRVLFTKPTGIIAEVISFGEESELGDITVRVKIPIADKSVKALLYIDSNEIELAPGDYIKFDAEFYELENTEEFAEKTYYKSRYIDLKGYTSEIQLVKQCSGIKIEFLPQYLARLVENKTDELYGDESSGFIKSLVFGNKKDLSDDFSDDLRSSGLSHTVSVSGMHISFIVGMLLYFSKNKYLKLATIPIIVLFVMVVGAPQSALRAVIMQILIIAASFVKREYDALTGLSVAAFILVVFNPYCATDIAFLLSFLATLGIIVAHPRIMSFLERFSVKEKGKRRKRSIDMLAAISVSVAASVFTMPVAAYNFDFVSLIAPISNLLLNFFITIAFTAGFLNTALGFICMPVARFFAIILDLYIGVIMDVISLLAKLPFSEIYTGDPRVLVFIFFVCAVFIYAISVGKKKLRPGYIAGFVLVAFCVFVGTSYITPSTENQYEGIRFDVLDVGQGQCVVATSEDTCVVVDCGGDEAADDIAVAHILKRGIDDIDAMIFTHAHSDHANGAAGLMAFVETKAVYMPATDRENATFVRLCADADEDCDMIFVQEDTLLEFEGMKINILTLPKGADENENGIVIIISDGEYDTLITGDIPIGNEKLILDRLPDCESYVVGHHGSKTSSSQALLNKALPELSVISVGVGNSYGHPSVQTLDRLQKIGSTVKRTDIEGSVTFYSGVMEDKVYESER